jgi:hypothetical protein
MNGIKCYLARDEVKKIVAEAVAQRLQPERLLGPCENDIQFFDDGRIEVIFWSPEAVVEDGEVVGSHPLDGPNKKLTVVGS